MLGSRRLEGIEKGVSFHEDFSAVYWSTKLHRTSECGDRLCRSLAENDQTEEGLKKRVEEFFYGYVQFGMQGRTRGD